ncbi:hypothetical protein NFI96_000884 [Prochilodus magdalenae]|nr:hypothetical protein NFI96_000884 [Prochilodus magdalenae]
MSGDELTKSLLQDDQDQDPVMESKANEEKTNIVNDSQTEVGQERGGAEPVDIDNSDTRSEVPKPSAKRALGDDEGERQRTDKSPRGELSTEVSISNGSMSPGNSEGRKQITSQDLDTSEKHLKESEPVSEKTLPLDDTSAEPSKCLSPTNISEQKPLSECNSEASDTEMKTDNPPEKELSTSRGRPRKEKRVIKCEYCGRPFNHASAYIIHRRVHTGEKPFSCQVCSRAFAQLSNLRSHMKVHNAPTMLSVQNAGRFPSKSTAAKTVTQNQPVTSASFRSDSHVKSSGPFRRSRKPVACPICGKIFPYKSVLKIHLRIHSGEKPYSCRVCGKSFTQACTVRVHERVHWSIKPFLCSKCGKGFSQIGTLKAHTCAGKKQIHATLKEMELAGVVTFRCHLCKKCFSTRDEYDPHVQTHTDNQRYICDSCGQKYSLRSELETHKKYCFSMWLANTKSYSRQAVVKLQAKHAPPTKTDESSQPGSTSTAVKSPKPSLPPPKTSRKPPTDFSQQPKRKKYLSLLSCPPKVMATSIYDPQNNLSYCQPFKASYFVSQLNSLDQKSDPRKYLCPRCGRLFRHVGRLRAHMLTHSRGKSFTCGDCGRISENWSQFWLHQRVHKQRRGRFFCPKCGQGFRFASIYMDHLQQHPELNAFFCPFCPHTFANAKSLKTHQQEWHRSSMPHICDICGKGFSSPVILKRHRVAHCFQNRQVDMPYMVEAEPAVKPYECGKCDTSFKTLDMLFSHQLCHSPNGDLHGSLSNGVGHNHEELKDEERSPQKCHKNDLHFRASTSQRHLADPCRDSSQGSPSRLSTDVPLDTAKTHLQQEHDTTLPASSSDSESGPLELDEEDMSPLSYSLLIILAISGPYGFAFSCA